MLRRLEIRNFAVISHCIFEPGNGLNVISGETGAGKSLLIDAIGLILGDKASKNLIRSDCDKAYVEAVFDLESLNDRVKDEVKQIAEENGIPEDEDLIISREINSDGRSSARINGRTCVLSVLKQISSLLVDIHGQNDTQKIFDESTHVGLLDRFAGPDAVKIKSEYIDILKRYKDTLTSIKQLGSSPEAQAKRREYLEFALNEISSANLKCGEDEELRIKKKMFADSAKINSILTETDEILYSSENNATDLLKRACGLLEKLSSIDESYKDLSDRIASLSLDVEAVASEIDGRISDDEYSEAKLDEIDKRLSLIYDLKSKYGNDLDEINLFAKNSREEIDKIDRSEEILDKLRKELKVIEKELLAKAQELSKLRHESALKLSTEIVRELEDLEMPGTRFEVVFTEHPKNRFFSAQGTEDIAFAFSANPGESPKPLSKIASGGEASRIMLAIKTILSGADDTVSLVFDEIDSGISGIAALKVAHKLKKISEGHQVLSVSHTAQIAASADMNFFIHKSSDLVSSHTEIKRLDEAGKINEVSRLLSGTDDEASKELARNLIDRF